MQVVIADDGSSDRPEQLLPLFESFFDISYIRQEDEGYRLSEVRNLGIREAKHDCIIVLDCDMLPEPSLVEAYMKFMHVSEKAVLIGGRRYVNTDDLTTNDVLEDISCVLNLPTQRVDTGRGPEGDEAPSEDWRYKHYRLTNYAKDRSTPSDGCGGNICIHRRQIEVVDESFTAWVRKIKNTVFVCTVKVLGSFQWTGPKPSIKNLPGVQMRPIEMQEKRSRWNNWWRNALPCIENQNPGVCMRFQN